AGAGENVTGCYYSKTADGKNLRSVTIMIRNECNKPIGMMCINMNTSAPLIDVLNIFNGAGKRERALKISFIYGKINFPAGRKRRK
ncbi:MAG: PAS domain-containing protein, partial [Treponema sp.]|nr:PAS domain-containing protein [Treponema sp.]